MHQVEEGEKEVAKAGLLLIFVLRVLLQESATQT
jgi:hypothetical protein